MATYKTSCPKCHGSAKLTEETTIKCQKCQGSGKFMDLFGNTHETVYGPLLCYRCGGRKQILTHIEKRCEHCHGAGSIDKEKPPLGCTTIKFAVHLVDQAGTMAKLDLKEVMNDKLGEYLCDFMNRDIYIDEVKVIEIPDNNNILCNIIHSDTSDHLLHCIQNYIEEDAPYADFLTLFYEDPDQNYFSLVMEAATVEQDLQTVKPALDDA